MDIVQTMDIDEISFSKLQTGQDDQKDEPLEVMDDPLLPAVETSVDMTKNTDREELMEAERKLQREEEEYMMYNQLYVGLLSDEEDSDMDTNDTAYTYFG